MGSDLSNDAHKPCAWWTIPLPRRWIDRLTMSG